MARSAISVLIHTKGEKTFGKHPDVQRFMKGVFEMRPVFPRYQITWDINILFNYFRKIPHQKHLTFKVLGKKLAILIAVLAGGQRCQTIHSINALHIQVLNDKCIIPIYKTLKQTRVQSHLKPLEFKVYSKEPKLCIVDNLNLYLKKTGHLRKHSQLFLSMQKPHHPVSRDTISRWCKSIMMSAGIDTKKYTTHSSRSAASSYAKAKGVSLEKVVEACGWSNEKTFARFYDKAILNGTNIGESLLNG